MPTPPRPPFASDNLISACLDLQDGSVPLAKLGTVIADYVNVRSLHRQSAASVLSAIRRAQHHTRRLHATEAGTTAAEERHKELMEEAKHFKKDSARMLSWERRNAADIAAYNNRKKIKRDKWIDAEEKVYNSIL